MEGGEEGVPEPINESWLAIAGTFTEKLVCLTWGRVVVTEPIFIFKFATGGAEIEVRHKLNCEELR